MNTAAIQSANQADYVVKCLKGDAELKLETACHCEAQCKRLWARLNYFRSLIDVIEFNLIGTLASLNYSLRSCSFLTFNFIIRAYNSACHSSLDNPRQHAEA